VSILSSKDFEKIAEFIYRKSGIALEEDKHFEKITRIVDVRSKHLGLDGFRKYFFILRFEDHAGNEFQELMNAVTVNETYFFRENYQFETLVLEVLPEIHKRKKGHEAIRILTAPSSSGEETYSIAIHLLEQNTIINERDFEIVGMDIDSTVIERAKKGLHTDRSLHALPPHIKSNYFSRQGLYNRISPDLSDALIFEVKNFLTKQV
jgi:chemotaxis protein methyltransferase CheR